MDKKFCAYLTLSFILLVLPSRVFAQDVLFGTVERVKRNSNIIIVAPVDGRPLVAPEELVLIQSRIPGIDEAIESARG